jgi:hypothetical protein
LRWLSPAPDLRKLNKPAVETRRVLFYPSPISLSVPPTTHGFKHRLAYVVDGERVLGYDNERGKGDHRHVAGRDEPYPWRGVDALTEDFTEMWRA